MAFETKTKQKKFNYTRNLIGTTWDIKKPRINSPYKELQYAKDDKDKERVEYWTALINIRKKQRDFLDVEWEKNGNKVKTEEDFQKYIKDPADKKAEKYFGKNSYDLHTGKFGDELIKQCQEKC